MDQVSYPVEQSTTEYQEKRGRAALPYLLISGLSIVLAVGLIVYSQTAAFAWDEGFHLLTAQLITRGKRPYLDFFFPQTPLNAYWNALWMRLFGDTWYVTHIVAAVLTAASAFLTADYLYLRFPVRLWQLTVALTAACVVGLNVAVFEFGTIGQAYALCLFLIVVAFRLTVSGAGRIDSVLPFFAGLMAGAAGGSSLLAAPVAPVLFVWNLLYSRAGNRWRKSALMVLGGIVAWTPIFRLYLQAPAQVLFNIVKYHLVYRQVDWSGAPKHDALVLTSWLESSQALLLGLLAIAGLLFVFIKKEWHKDNRAEFYLCAWLSVAQTLHISTAHPTFARYFLLTVPFLTVLAMAGLFYAGSSFGAAGRPWLASSLLLILVSAALARALFNDREDAFSWKDWEKVAQKVDAVTPPGAPVWADEQLYFLTRRQPPEGMESADSHKLRIPANQSTALHLLAQPEVERRAKAGAFSTIVICKDDDKGDELGLPKVYKQKEDIGDCTVFWDRLPESKPVR